MSQKEKIRRQQAETEASRLKILCFEPFELAGKHYCIYRHLPDLAAPPAIYFKNLTGQWHVLDGQPVDDKLINTSFEQLGRAQHSILVIAERKNPKKNSGKDFPIGENWFTFSASFSMETGMPPADGKKWTEFMEEIREEKPFVFMLVRDAKPWDHSQYENFLSTWSPPQIQQGVPSPSCSAGRGPNSECNAVGSDPEGPIEKPIDTRPDPAPTTPPVI